MTSFFHTEAAAFRLERLHDAVYALLGELQALRMTALATAVLELLDEDAGITRVYIGTTEEKTPSMVPGADEERVVHFSMRTEPGNQLVELPLFAVAPLVTGEGQMTLHRTDPFVADALFNWQEGRKEEAVVQLSRAMDTEFLSVFNAARTNPVV